jgi:lipopolysaccharide/colanic/teichoic acid biosynthesis glycosyltransferase
MTPAESLRRRVEMFVAIVGGFVLAPVLLAAAIATRITAGPGVIYRQTRLGRGGAPFDLVKFRTMRRPAPGRENPEFDNERLTRVGTWLRSTSIDELPSLWNLFRGEIALVGPRPLPVHYFPRFRGDEYERFQVRPGITGLAQVAGRNAVDWDERLALDVRYVRTRSLLGDTKLLFATVPAVLGGAGVDQADGVTMAVLPGDRPGDRPEKT